MIMVGPNTLEITATNGPTQRSLHLEFSHTSLQINLLAISLSQTRRNIRNWLQLVKMAESLDSRTPIIGLSKSILDIILKQAGTKGHNFSCRVSERLFSKKQFVHVIGDFGDDKKWPLGSSVVPLVGPSWQLQCTHEPTITPRLLNHPPSCPSVLSV